MIIEFPIEDTVKKRSSVRNYSDRQIEPEKINAIKRFVEELDNPFDKEVIFH
ncbi:MAG: nitroreductase, partial [Coriobacteriaceae bacterium]|nr:nitroreductase [Coriobacteriaceae bacterium]